MILLVYLGISLFVLTYIILRLIWAFQHKLLVLRYAALYVDAYNITNSEAKPVKINTKKLFKPFILIILQFWIWDFETFIRDEFVYKVICNFMNKLYDKDLE